MAAKTNFRLRAIIFWALVFGAATAAEAHSPCITTMNGFLCPPPFGDLVKNWNGQYVCGPGACVISSSGKVYCSSQIGGGG